MHLVMFDIDGTLTDTVGVDEECYVRALLDVFDSTDIDTEWSTYAHATDSGIFRQIYQLRSGQPPTFADISRFRQYFVHLIAAALAQSPFVAVAGADQLMLRLASSPVHRISLATGGWSDSARLKMASAGMCFDDHPAATADDAFDRESIMRLSRQRAAERHGVLFSRTVYVGDGVWDARACRALGVPFIGVGSGVRSAQLYAEGAVHVFPDLSQPDLFLETLEGITRA
jgi:phosphoglycolate phosphatase-like HAD superfamily hydrolase